MDAIRKLEAQIGKEIFNAYSLNELKTLRKQLLTGGDLHEFNWATGHGAPSAAIGQLIEFRMPLIA